MLCINKHNQCSTQSLAGLFPQGSVCRASPAVLWLQPGHPHPDWTFGFSAPQGQELPGAAAHLYLKDEPLLKSIALAFGFG